MLKLFKRVVIGAILTAAIFGQAEAHKKKNHASEAGVGEVRWISTPGPDDIRDVLPKRVKSDQLRGGYVVLECKIAKTLHPARCITVDEMPADLNLGKAVAKAWRKYGLAAPYASNGFAVVNSAVRIRVDFGE